MLTKLVKPTSHSSCTGYIMTWNELQTHV